MTAGTMTNLEIYIIQPSERTNLIENPSIETGTTGYTAINATISSDTSYSRYGIASLKIIPTDANAAGAYYSIVLTNGTTYQFSASILGTAGVRYKLAVLDDTGMAVEVEREFLANGHWQRKSVEFTADESDTFYLAVIRLEGQSDTSTYWVDGYQLEVGNEPTTFICGDNESLGMVDERAEYYWVGEPNASKSVRKWWTQSGGTLLRLRDYCRIISIDGIGLPDIRPVSVPMMLGGSIYQFSRPGSRLISMTLDFTGSDPGEVQSDIAVISSALDITSAMHNQLLRLMLVGYNSDGTVEGSDTVFLDVAYRGGLEGSFSSYRHERRTIVFEQYAPAMIGEGWSEYSLAYQQALSGYCLVRVTRTGTYDNMGITAAADGQGNCMVKDRNGVYYLGGLFGNLNSIIEADYVAKLDTSGAWKEISSSTLNDQVRCMLVDNLNRVWFGGSFTNAGGNADADYICRINENGDTFYSVVASGYPCNGAVYALAMSRVGQIYVGGAFTDISNTGADYLARFDGTNWNAVKSATALNGTVYAVIPDPWGDGVIVGGNFTNAGGTTGLNYLARVTVSGSTYDYVALTDLDAPNGAIYAIHYDPNLGRLYVMGNFTTIGGTDANRIAYWDGSNWIAMDTGFNALNQLCGMVSEHGKLHCACNGATYAGSVKLPDGYAIWDGNQWIAPKFDISGSAGSRSVYYDPDTDDLMYLGPVSGTKVEGVTSVEVEGYAETYPVLTIVGPGTVYGIKSYITGQRVDFNELNLITGETVTIQFTSSGYIVRSTVRNSIANQTGGGSGTLKLVPGTNKIGLFVYGSTTSETAATLRFRQAYRSFGHAIWSD